MENNGDHFELVARTFKGLEDVLADEISALGAEDVKVLNRAVSFRADKSMMYKANLWLRTALKVLKPVYSFTAKNESELYSGISEINWDEFLHYENTLSIQAVVNSNYFNHSQYVALKSKDAIVDQFRNKFGKRPSIDTEHPDILIDIRINEDQCVVSLDSSGESLHKRGYRVNSTIAPVNEVLAAGMILLTDWDRESNFFDPMCGSGTLPIEAALIAYNIPPGIFRKEFGFENWKDFDPDLLESIYNDDSEEYDFHYRIIGSDVSPGAIRIATDNAKNASLNHKIEFKIQSFESTLPTDEKTLLLFNPPYGERIKKNNIDAFYQMIGTQLKRNFAGQDVWILSGNRDAFDNIGLHPSRKITLYNGNIECKFQQYAMYNGSKKDKKLDKS